MRTEESLPYKMIDAHMLSFMNSNAFDIKLDESSGLSVVRCEPQPEDEGNLDFHKTILLFRHIII
jgi:hypothetical protein